MNKYLKNFKLITALDTVKGRIAISISAAFTFVIALSWNVAINKGLIN